MQPIKLSSTKDSQESVTSGLLAFQHWAKSQSRNGGVPPALTESLKEHVLEPDLQGLFLDDAFHLYIQTRRDSSATISIFDFDASASDVIKARKIKSYCQDVFQLDLQSGALNSKIGWAQGSHEHQSTAEIPEEEEGADARSLLLEHWICPRRWMKDGRLVVVRPDDLSSGKSEEDGRDSARRTKGGVALCQSAVTWLQKGFTLLLVKGDLIQVSLPWDKNKPMLFAGLMFKEGKPQKPNPQLIGDDGDAGNKGAGSRGGRRNKRPGGRPDELAFIIAEKAQRRTRFSGIQAQEQMENPDTPGHQFLEGMYQWHENDVYKYIPGVWCV